MRSQDDGAKAGERENRQVSRTVALSQQGGGRAAWMQVCSSIDDIPQAASAWCDRATLPAEKQNRTNPASAILQPLAL